MKAPFTMAALLAGVALLGAGAACAQGHDPGAAAARGRVQQAEATPEVMARRLAEKQVWLQRLVGRFHARSVMTSGTPYVSSTPAYTESASTQWSSDYSAPRASSWSPSNTVTSPEKEGRAECVAIGIGVDVSCLIDLRTLQGTPSMVSLRVSLPLPPPDEIGRMLEVEGTLQMGSDEGRPLKWVALKGNTAIFSAECQKRASGEGRAARILCGTRVSITARPDGTRVRVLIEGQRYQSAGTTTFVLNRPRQYTGR